MVFDDTTVAKVVENTDSITIKGTKMYTHTAFRTQSAVNLSRFNKLYIDVVAKAGGSAQYGYYRSSDTSFIEGKGRTSESLDNIGLLECNISSVSGLNFVGLYIEGSSAYGSLLDVTIKQIYLTR